MAAVIAPADRADLARKPMAGLVSIMSARSGSAWVDISITGTGAPSSPFLKCLSKIEAALFAEIHIDKRDVGS